MSKLRWYYNRVKSYIGRPRLLVQEKVIVVDDDNRCEEPVFIVGPHRSGTSLVRRMFNSHPDIACPPETFFITHYADMLDDENVASGYSGFGQGKEEMQADLARKASSLHEAFRLSQGKSLWADKTPEYTLRIDDIDRLFGRKPRYVFVMRHPGDVVNSIYSRGWTFNEIEDPFESNLQYVRACIDALEAFEQDHGNRCSRLDYRLLCEDPASTLRDVMAKIGLEYHEDMLRFGEKNHNYGREDPVVRGKKKVEASAGAWQSWSKAQKERAAEVFGDKVLTDIYW